MPFEKAYYLIGYNYTVPVDKRISPELYAKMRTSAKSTGVTTIEYGDIRHSPGLFGGLTMTVAAMGQPVVSRAALLHLGNKSTLGVNIYDDYVGLGEFPATDLHHNLVDMVHALQNQSCRNSASH